VANVNVGQDSVPDVAVAGGEGYVVIDGAKLVDPANHAADQVFLWGSDTRDCSSASTGSSVFDFNGDGAAEVLYGDEKRFRIYEGATGDVLFETCNTNGTIREHPVVADVDNDGEADIVVVSNARYFECTPEGSSQPTRQSGVRVFSSAAGNWVRTRRVWNQHAYHITNIEEDGTVPMSEPPAWDDPELNSFRQNRQPGRELVATDAVVTLAPQCDSPQGLRATVVNAGEALMPPGAEVRFYRGSYSDSPPESDRLGVASTTRTLHPAQSEDVSIELGGEDAQAILRGEQSVFAIVDPPSGVPECRADNNHASGLAWTCNVI
jgi:hypothetical protein